jgi:Large polyvalent protein associated domain 29
METMMSKEERKAVGNQIRDALKAAFPSTKFSVVVWQQGYWGATYGVRWASGPSEDVVQRALDGLKLPPGFSAMCCQETEAAE